MSISSVFSSVELAPRDPILGLTEAFNADTRSKKVNLGVGVYYDGEGKLPLLEAVRAAEKLHVNQQKARGYQPIEGPAAYSKAVQHLIFGKASSTLAEKRVLTVQTLGGTGALKIGADFLKRLLPDSKVYISNPSWENHRALFEGAGFVVESYAYYDPDTHGVQFEKTKESLSALAENSIVLLHACCHNPTGADFSMAQWKEVISICRERRLIAFLDMAYQGFADSIETDSEVVQTFAESGLQFLVASSFSKNFSLYGERIGSLSIVSADESEAERVRSQVKRIIRTNYSNPPTHGGEIVRCVLESEELRDQWQKELSVMRERIHSMRQDLVEALHACGVNQDFSFICKQRGMFSYTGLSAQQVERLKTEFGIYSVSSGRICIAALNINNLQSVAKAIAAVLE